MEVWQDVSEFVGALVAGSGGFFLRMKLSATEEELLQIALFEPAEFDEVRARLLLREACRRGYVNLFRVLTARALGESAAASWSEGVLAEADCALVRDACRRGHAGIVRELCGTFLDQELVRRDDYRLWYESTPLVQDILLDFLVQKESRANSSSSGGEPEG